jgi:hypothetical protein
MEGAERAATITRHDCDTTPTGARPKVVPHLTVDERTARGKAARAEIPRSRHAKFDSPADRTDPIELLEDQARTRVQAVLEQARRGLEAADRAERAAREAAEHARESARRVTIAAAVILVAGVLGRLTLHHHRDFHDVRVEQRSYRAEEVPVAAPRSRAVAFRAQADRPPSDGRGGIRRRAGSRPTFCRSSSGSVSSR